MNLQTSLFDRAQIEGHCRMLFDRAAGIDGKLVVSVFAEDPDTGEKWARNHHFLVRERDIAGMVACVMAYANEPHANVYAALAVMRPDLPERDKGGEADVIAVLGAVVDSDADTGKTAQPPWPADYVIESSAGNAQHICFFPYPIAVKDAKPFLTRLTTTVGGDHCGRDCSHVWRISGAQNWPTKRKIERGRPRDPQGVRTVKPYAGTCVSWDAWNALPPVSEVSEAKQSQLSGRLE